MEPADASAASAPVAAGVPAVVTAKPADTKSARAARAARGARAAVPGATATRAARHVVAPWATAAPKTTAPVAPTVTAPAAAATVYGISDPEIISQSPAVQVQQLEAMKAMGMTSIRLDANWYWGQLNGPGSFDWASLDQAVASIRQAGLSADLIIDGCPPWAAVAGEAGNEWAQPASPAAFATWARAVAARYGASVRYFEIWNEPNLAATWAPAPNPAAYTADLKAAYAAIKSVDGSSVVLSAGLAPAANSGSSVDPRTFLEDMYANGAGGSFDGLGDHPYSYPVSPDADESYSAWSQMSQTSPSLRSIMVANGDGAKKIYITEYGAPTIGPVSIGETGQATELVQAISQVKKLSWVGSFYIYTWSDLATFSTVNNGFGLLNEGSAPKPAYSAVVSALAS